MTASKTYSVPGTYTATVKVTDAAGLTSMKSVTITATSTTTPTVTTNNATLSVAAISVTVSKGAKVEARANVTVRDGAGNMVGGATVTGTWSGAVSGTGSGITGSTGVATIKSSRTQESGQFIFTVNNVSLSGYQYLPANNTETSDSATR